MPWLSVNRAHSMWKTDSDGISSLLREMQNLCRAFNTHDIAVIGVLGSDPQLDAGRDAALDRQDLLGA